MKRIVSKMKTGSNGRCVYLGLLFLLALSLLAGCSSGDDGKAGQPGSSSGTLSGTVTNSLTGGGVAGAAITTDPAIEGLEIETDASGNYSASLPIGTYKVTAADTNFTSQTEENVTLVATQTETLDFDLVPTSPVVVTISGVPDSSVPGETFGLTAKAESMDGSTVTGYSWTQTSSAAATIENGTTATPTITLGDEAAYLTQLMEELTVRNGELFVNLDRVMIQGASPFALEQAGHVAFQVEVTTTSGTYKGTADVHSTLAFASIKPGIGKVPNMLPVLLSGKEQATYNWTLTGPIGSSAAINNGTIRNPTFTPDVTGSYTATESVSGQTLNFVATNWIGSITGEDASGRPLSAACTGCHNGTFAPDKFTDWRESGHAEIFTNNLNTSTHYGTGCFMCHTVGFDTSVSNNGFDDQSDYAAFLDGGLLNNPSPNNWTTMLSKYPNAAKEANIQCENCHGPQGAPHPSTIEAGEMDISSDVCATCHGEPKRHARFQQWRESNHGNFELAIDRGTSTSCARCHTGQGFLVYVPQIEGGDPGSLPSSAITWTADTVQPQTCVACHDPHKQGTTSGEPNTATVRIEGNTPMLPAGFQANGVGRGAVCMVCHNSRNGARNDTTGTADDREPHTASQTDVIMGQNAYFVSLAGTRSPHSLLTDTCATCHMEETPPPADFSYNLGGTNHTFSASMTICKDCHGDFDGGGIQAANLALLHDLETALETAIANEITAQTTAGNTVTVTGDDETGTETTRVVTDGNTVSKVVFTGSHGRQAMDLTFTDGQTITHIQLAGGTVVSGGVDLTFISSAAGQLIAKAGWNYFLIEGDGSLGVHNNKFSQTIMQAAIAALQ